MPTLKSLFVEVDDISPLQVVNRRVINDTIEFLKDMMEKFDIELDTDEKNENEVELKEILLECQELPILFRTRYAEICNEFTESDWNVVEQYEDLLKGVMIKYGMK